MSGEYKLGISSFGEKMHYSVGAIIRNSQGKYLLVDRLQKPLGYAGLAGHVDVGESSLDALVREIYEESGLSVKGDPNLLFEEEVNNNECRGGVSIHYWKLYFCQVDGDLVFNPKETKSIDWYSLDEISQLNLEPVWKYWFHKYRNLI